MWQPGGIAFAVLASFAGGCATWSWYQADVGAAVGAFIIGFFFAVCARASDVERAAIIVKNFQAEAKKGKT